MEPILIGLLYVYMFLPNGQALSRTWTSGQQRIDLGRSTVTSWGVCGRTLYRRQENHHCQTHPDFTQITSNELKWVHSEPSRSQMFLQATTLRWSWIQSKQPPGSRWFRTFFDARAWWIRWNNCSNNWNIGTTIWNHWGSIMSREEQRDQNLEVWLLPRCFSWKTRLG